MTMTLREVQHLSMEAWPCGRECRGHDPAKKKESDVACSVGKLCTYTLQYIGHERNMKKHVTKHRLLLESIHELKSLESSNSEQHNGNFRETRRGQAGQESQDKDTHRERKLAGTVAHHSLPVFQTNFQYLFSL